MFTEKFTRWSQYMVDHTSSSDLFNEVYRNCILQFQYKFNCQAMCERFGLQVAYC